MNPIDELHTKITKLEP